jgi:hypothetical protein
MPKVTTKSWLFLALFAAAVPLSAHSAVAAPADDEGGGETVEDYLQKLSTIPDVVNRKDPFIQAAAPFTVPKDVLSEGVDMSVPVLERYPVSKYEIVATLLGDQYPRALLRLPKEEKGKVLIVREKDKLGNKGGIITKILKDGVSVVQKTRSPLGFIDKQETMIRVGSGDEADKKEKEDKPAEIRQGAPAPYAQPFSTGGQVTNPYQR